MCDALVKCVARGLRPKIITGLLVLFYFPPETKKFRVRWTRTTKSTIVDKQILSTLLLNQKCWVRHPVFYLYKSFFPDQ